MIKLFQGVPEMEGVKKSYMGKYMDSRGWFSQVWTSDELKASGFREGFVQNNIAQSRRGVFRGMHRQNQTKLVQVISGNIFDVVLNPETGEWNGYSLTEGEILFVPPQYAHGYFVISDTAVVQYFVDRPYNKDEEEIFNYKAFGISLPVEIEVILSEKDA